MRPPLGARGKGEARVNIAAHAVGTTAGIFEPPVLMYTGHVNCRGGDYFIRAHSHELFTELVLMTGGHAAFTINGEPYTVKAGDLILFGRGIEHEELYPQHAGGETYYCAALRLFTPEMEARAAERIRQQPVLHTGPLYDRMVTLMEGVYSECRDARDDTALICEGYLRVISAYLLRLLGLADGKRPEESGSPIISEVKSYIDNHFTESLQLKDIAGAHYISRFYLSHIFKEETGYSPIHYLIGRRIEEAKRLLADTQMSIQDIAQYVGYDNPSHFNSLFKRETGMSAAAYRRWLRSAENRTGAGKTSR